MSRRLFAATAVAAVCVGSSAMAIQSPPEGSEQAISIQPVPAEVLSFLSPDQARSRPQGYLSRPELGMPGQTSSCINLSAPPSGPVPHADSDSTAEIPLIPLPSPVWTGSAGLAFLGVVRGGKALRKTLY